MYMKQRVTCTGNNVCHVQETMCFTYMKQPVKTHTVVTALQHGKRLTAIARKPQRQNLPRQPAKNR